MIKLNDINSIIEKIKVSLYEVVEENNLGYMQSDPEVLLNLYCADFCGILLSYFPGATVMMNKNYRNCALLINGKIYTASGISKDVNDYFVAGEQEKGCIQKSFHQMSQIIIEKLLEKLSNQEQLDKDYAYSLRKNMDYLT